MIVWIFSELPKSISIVLIYYSPLSDIWVKSYDSLNFLGASAINFESLDILWSTIRDLSPKLSQFESAWSFRNQFRGCRYIMVCNQKFESKVMEVWIFQELPCSILTVLIYNYSQWNIRVKSYDSLNLLGASVINFDGLDILWSTIIDLSPKLCQCEFAQSFHNQFRGCWYIMVRN